MPDQDDFDLDAYAAYMEALYDDRLTFESDRLDREVTQ